MMNKCRLQAISNWNEDVYDNNYEWVCLFAEAFVSFTNKLCICALETLMIVITITKQIKIITVK